MIETNCVRCGRPMPDQAYACAHCAAKATEQLHTIADMCPAARDVAHGLSRRGGGGASSGKPGSQLPLDLGATSKLDAVQNELSGWARHIAAERGVGMPFAGGSGLDQIVLCAEWLSRQMEWLRHRREVEEALGSIQAAARVVAGIARGPASQKYLGPCGAFEVDDREEGDEGPPCEGDIYAREGASVGRCRTCGAEVSSGERAAWLDGEVRSHAFRAAQIAQAYGVNVNTIRSWAARGALLAHGQDREERPLYNVGEVLDLAAADAARRAGEQAKRARRAAARAAESEDAA